MNILYQKFNAYMYMRNHAALLASLKFGDDPNQFFLVSYPKSGNTWLRMLLANLLKEGGELISLVNVGNYVPDVNLIKQRQYVMDPKSIFNHLPYRIIKTHDPYFNYYHDKKVIYIVRDGRDAMTSYYHYLNARSEIPVSIRDLITWNKKLPMGPWSQHVMGWLKGKCLRKIIVRYEDLVSDPHLEILKLLQFLEWEFDESKIQEAVENSTFENLKKIEEKYGGVNESRTESGKMMPFFRKGIVNDWQSAFSEEDIRDFWRYHKKGMDAFNYSIRSQINL